MEENKMRECPFCGQSAGYDEKEMRIECTNTRCKAIVWFDFDVPSDVNEEEYISRENKERWQKRTEDQSIASMLYGLSERKSTEFQRSLYDIAKYGGLADSLYKAKKLIREIQEELDSVNLSEELLKVIERLDRQ
ncbi:MAG: hypothetical protein IKO10_19145 [Lachnospiraceae bacterium]|nr:hypothetical protein [Lachnospiraceae bacterium]